VRAGRGDRVVADRVAVGPGPGVEHALNEPFAAVVGARAGQVPDNVLEAAGRGGDGEAHLGDLVGVLDQAQLRQAAGELLVGGMVAVDLEAERRVGGVGREHLLRRESEAGLVDLGGEERVGLPQHEALGVDRVHDQGQVGDAAHGHAEVGGNLGDPGARADPEFADIGVCVELVRVAAGPLSEVEGGVVAGRCGFEHQHGAGLGVAAPAGEVRKGRVRAERVVGVVGALLETTGGDDQTLSGVHCGKEFAAGGREVRLLAGER